MSFMLTTAAFKDRSKTVTRRLGWKFLKPGDMVMGVKKAQGLKPGEKIQRLGKIRIVNVEREPLALIGDHPNDTALEGFPDLTNFEFVGMFCKHMKCVPNAMVNRIEFEYVD